MHLWAAIDKSAMSKDDDDDDEWTWPGASGHLGTCVMPRFASLGSCAAPMTQAKASFLRRADRFSYSRRTVASGQGEI